MLKEIHFASLIYVSSVFSFLNAMPSSEIQIESGDCVFNAAYAVSTPSNPSDLIVKFAATRGMNICTSIDGPICPMPLGMRLKFTLNDVAMKVQLHQKKNGNYKIKGLHKL